MGHDMKLIAPRQGTTRQQHSNTSISSNIPQYLYIPPCSLLLLSLLWYIFIYNNVFLLVAFFFFLKSIRTSMEPKAMRRSTRC